jgi:hypothetical protein
MSARSNFIEVLEGCDYEYVKVCMEDALYWIGFTMTCTFTYLLRV